MQAQRPDDPVVNRLRCPKFMDYKMPENAAEPKENILEQVKYHLKEHDIQYPFVIKVLKASRTKYSHSFFVVTREEGLSLALTFEGFEGEHIVFQEWIKHHE